MLVGVITVFSSSVASSATLSGSNIQQIGLLPSQGLPPSTSIGGGEITIVGSALLPDTESSHSVADSNKSLSNDQISIYVVRPGDTVSEIAEMYQVSVNTIRWANELSPKATIKEGQVLVILPINGLRHTVIKGDTLASLAKKYQGDAEEIVNYNILTNRTLTVGSTIIIPGGIEPQAVVKPSVTPKGSKGSSPSGGANPVYVGYYLRPINGGVKTQGIHGYNAVDLASRSGTPVMASASGTVIISRQGGWNGGYGNYVVVQHSNSTQTLYAHLLQTNVSTGQRVDQGQTIGLLGSSGNSTGPHVHFEIRGAKNPF